MYSTQLSVAFLVVIAILVAIVFIIYSGFYQEEVLVLYLKMNPLADFSENHTGIMENMHVLDAYTKETLEPSSKIGQHIFANYSWNDSESNPPRALMVGQTAFYLPKGDIIAAVATTKGINNGVPYTQPGIPFTQQISGGNRGYLGSTGTITFEDKTNYTKVTLKIRKM